MNRQERRSKSRHMRDRCAVCDGSLRGGPIRMIGGGPAAGVTGHIECIDGVVEHLVEEHGLVYLGDFQVEP